MPTQSLPSKFAAIRWRALKFAGRRNSDSFSKKGSDHPTSLSDFSVSKNDDGPPGSVFESPASSEISARDYPPPSSRESESDSQMIGRSSYQFDLPNAPPLQIQAASYSSDNVANSDLIQFLSNNSVDSWDNEEGAAGEDSAYCLSVVLREAADDALLTFEAMLQEHSLNDSLSIQAYLAQCSVESLERFFVTAADAKNAAILRRSAILHDVDYFLRKLAPLIKIYQNDVIALGNVEESIELLRKECNKDNQRFVDLCNLENRLPGDTCFSPSFTYTHQASQAKVEVHRQQRPMARYFSRQLIEEGRPLTDRDAMLFWEQ